MISRTQARTTGNVGRGRQHSGTFRRIDEHVGIRIQEVAPDNPYPVKGWELIGIEPDVRVTSAEALETAKTLTTSRLIELVARREG